MELLNVGVKLLNVGMKLLNVSMKLLSGTEYPLGVPAVVGCWQ
jgi:hypothetical protein